MKAIDIEQGEVFEAIEVNFKERAKQSCATFAIAYGRGYHFEVESLTDIVFEEDETISCKDSASGISCLKVKKGGHFKPFYQTSRY